MLTFKQNVRSILDCHFTGFRDDIIDSAVESIAMLNPKSATSCDGCQKTLGKLITFIKNMKDFSPMDGNIESIYVADTCNKILDFADELQQLK